MVFLLILISGSVSVSLSEALFKAVGLTVSADSGQSMTKRLLTTAIEEVSRCEGISLSVSDTRSAANAESVGCPVGDSMCAIMDLFGCCAVAVDSATIINKVRIKGCFMSVLSFICLMEKLQIILNC